MFENLNQLTDDELRELIDRANTVLAGRNAALLPEFTFDFEATNDPRKGVPYVAQLVYREGKLERRFFDMTKSYGRKSVTVAGKYTARPGDVVEIRTGGSWKNDYRTWNLCTDEGELHEVAHIQDSRNKLHVEQYLRGEKTAQELIRA